MWLVKVCLMFTACYMTIKFLDSQEERILKWVDRLLDYLLTLLSLLGLLLGMLLGMLMTVLALR